MAEEGAPLTLFHVSDLHFGAEDRAALDWFAAAVASERPDGVICTGDLTMRGTAREFAAAGAWLRALPVPLAVEPGNHDLPYYWEMPARLRHPFARYHAMVATLPAADADPRLTLVSLRTVVPAQWRLDWSKGSVQPGALAAAIAQLADAPPATLRLVLCHQPLVDADTHGKGSTRGGKAALAALASAGADAVLSGHVHDPFDLTIPAGGRSMRIIGAGTLSERLRATRPSYNRLEWTRAAGLSVTVRAMA